jgi:DNA-binding response OmpR family regulator
VDAGIDILVIDDNDLQLHYLQELLKSHGYTVQTVQEGSKAIELIQKYNPRLIILDVMMPGVDGLTILKRIRDNKKIESIPVIIYSGKGFTVDQKKATFLGANSFLVKPVKGSVLIEEVKKYL